MSSSADNTIITTCANCGKAESDAVNFKPCTSCKMVKYCSRVCQVTHHPKHITPCKQRAAELFDEELFKDSPEGKECPVCMLPLPFNDSQAKFYSCCAKILCMGCVHAQLKEDIRNGRRREDCGLCPFCRAPAGLVEEDELDRLKKGVERNDVRSMEHLALDYMDGEIVQKDLAKAMELFKRAGELGCPSAYGWLGNIYSKRAGYEKDKTLLGTCRYWRKR